MLYDSWATRIEHHEEDIYSLYEQITKEIDCGTYGMAWSPADIYKELPL